MPDFYPPGTQELSVSFDIKYLMSATEGCESLWVLGHKYPVVAELFGCKRIIMPITYKGLPVPKREY